MPYYQNTNKGGAITIYRPNEAKYAEGHGPTVYTSIADARANFIDEFGADPEEPYVIEVTVNNGRASAFVMELGE
jgi:hypothetical protein